MLLRQVVACIELFALADLVTASCRDKNKPHDVRPSSSKYLPVSMSIVFVSTLHDFTPYVGAYNVRYPRPEKENGREDIYQVQVKIKRHAIAPPMDFYST